MVKCDNDLHFRCQYGVVHSSDSFWSDSENPCHNSFPDTCRAQLFENNAYSVKRFSAAALVLKVAAKLAHGYEKVRHNKTTYCLSIHSVYQIHHHLDHSFHLLRAADRNHQRDGDQGAVRNAFAAVWTVENPVVIHEPKE